MKDSAEPLDGWHLPEIHRACIERNDSRPNNDIYGHLYFQIKEELRNFYNKLRTLSVDIIVLSLNATALRMFRSLLPPFDRVDVSNIADEGYIGLNCTLKCMEPLLNECNEHATLITQFLNAVPAVAFRSRNNHAYATRMVRTEATLEFLPVVKSTLTAEVERFSLARNLFLDMDLYFHRYLNMVSRPATCIRSGMYMKQGNTIVEKWPYRLQKEFGEPGAREEFENLLASGLSGTERYVEWQSLSGQAQESLLLGLLGRRK